MLINHGSICTDDVINAFREVDRGFFIDAPDLRSSEEIRFVNMPFRNGIQHLSAPSIYGTALEALDLQRGQSFSAFSVELHDEGARHSKPSPSNPGGQLHLFEFGDEGGKLLGRSACQLRTRRE